MASATLLNLLSDIADVPEAAAGGAAAAAVALPMVSRLLGGTLATWNRVSFRGGLHAEQVIADPPGAWVESAVEDVEPKLGEHPLAGTVFTRADIVRLSDVISDRRWVSHPIYSDLLRPHGIPRFSVVVPLTLRSDEIAFLMFNRDRDFRPREIEALTVLQGGLSVLLRSREVSEVASSVLTPREVEVLRVLARGASRTATARELGISTSTVAKHVENIHTKLDTHDIVSTLRAAQERGITLLP